MKRIRDHIDEDLLIVQPRALRPHYEIRSGDSVVGFLAFQSILGSIARAESEDGGWTFARTGFPRRRVSIRLSGHEDEIASYVKNAWSREGTLQMPDGRRLRVLANFLLTAFAFTTEQGSTLVRYSRIRGFFHRSGTIRILPEAATMEELPWLVPLGWYIAVSAIQDRAARAG